MRKLLRTIVIACLSVIIPDVLSNSLTAAERPTLVRTCDPRPDIIPRPYYESTAEYRAVYNRPRYLVGKLAWYTSRTSQEAMVWEENYCAGNYECKDMPPVCKRYMYPKPWEILNTGPRFDPQQKPSFTRPETAVDATENESSKEEEVSSRKTADEKTENKAEDKAKDTKPESKDKAESKEKAESKSDKTEKPVVPSPSDR